MDYKSPAILFNHHIETIYPSLFRKVNLPDYRRERITTPDSDFLDLDWLDVNSDKLIIISHGLEGNSSRAYIKGMANIASQKNISSLAWNYRGCSGEMNKSLRFYHSGATDDLETVIKHAISKAVYKEIYLVGFSLGGNLTLKYLGEDRQIPLELVKAVTFSVPLDLEASCEKISSRSNWIYARRFLKSLKFKVIEKSKVMAGLHVDGIDKINSLVEFDNRYTAPLHGFNDAHDYYSQCSAIRFIDTIKIPTLIVNAQNDPFLSKECYPTLQLRDHPYVTLETPQHGGHVGFAQFNKNGVYWSETRAMNFILS